MLFYITRILCRYHGAHTPRWANFKANGVIDVDKGIPFSVNVLLQSLLILTKRAISYTDWVNDKDNLASYLFYINAVYQLWHMPITFFIDER